MLRGEAHDDFLLVDAAFFQHVQSHGQSGHTSALADAALQHVEDAVLDGELDVEHVVVVVFEDAAHLAEFLIGFGHQLLHRVHVLVLLVLGVVVQRVGGTDASHHVFALGVDEPFAVELVVASGGVTCEGHTGSGCVAHVAKHHRLHVDGGAPVVRNAFDAAVADGLLTVPTLEHGLDAAFELGLGVVRELSA